MELSINVTKLAGDDSLGLCKSKDTGYKRCTRYQGLLNEKLEQFFASEGFQRVSTTGSIEEAMFLFNKGTIYWKIKNRLTISKPTEASIGVVVDKDGLVKVEALLKRLRIPKNTISIIH